MDREEKCYYCERRGVEQKRVVIDVEADHDIDNETNEVLWYSRPIYSMVWLCEEHINETDEGDQYGEY